MAVSTHLVTVEEFRKLPEDSGPVYHELPHGEVVAVTRPKLKHYILRVRLRDLLKAIAPAGSLLEYEFAFRALPEYELRVADVAYVSRERWQATERTVTYRPGEEIPPSVLGSSRLAVDEIFA